VPGFRFVPEADIRPRGSSPQITTPDTIETRLGTSKFFDGFPDKDTVEKVYDNLDFQRGVEVFLNTMPGASLYAMREGLRSVGSCCQRIPAPCFLEALDRRLRVTIDEKSARPDPIAEYG
jgi:hypothetical protein